MTGPGKLAATLRGGFSLGMSYWRLRSTGHLGISVDLPTDVKPLGVSIDAELGRGVEFSRIRLGGRLHRLSGWRFHPALKPHAIC